MNLPVPGPQSVQNHTLPKGVSLPQVKAGFGAATGGRAKWDDGIKWGELPEKAWTQLRFYGDVYLLATSWIKHQKSGKKFPLLSLAWDPETKHFSRSGDPILEDFDPRNSTNPEIKDITPRQHGYGHAIFRQAQQMNQIRPWAPVKLPISLILSIQRLSGMNVHIIDGQRYEADVTDPYWGADVYVLYDSTARAEQKYQVQIGPKVPLTEEEMSYISQQYDWKSRVVWPSREEVIRSLRENGYYDLIAPQNHMVSQPAVPPSNFGMLPPPPFPQVLPPQAPPPVQQPEYQQVYAPQPPAVQQMYAPQPPAVQQPDYPQAPQGMQAPSTASFAPPPAPPVQAQAMPPQPFGAPPIPMAPPQAPVNAAPVSPVPVGLRPSVPASAPAAEGLIELDDIPFDGAAESAATGQEVTERTYQVVGKGKPMGQGAFQTLIGQYAEATKRLPLRACSRGELEGIDVLTCYSQYRGDSVCMKCPLRRYCIEG